MCTPWRLCCDDTFESVLLLLASWRLVQKDTSLLSLEIFADALKSLVTRVLSLLDVLRAG